MDLYREHILEHYREPRNWGLREDAALQATQFNPLCGDRVTVQLDLKGEKVADMRFEGHGCAVSIASASLLSEWIVGKSPDEVAALGPRDIQTILEIPLQKPRLQCALLAVRAAQSALVERVGKKYKI